MSNSRLHVVHYNTISFQFDESFDQTTFDNVVVCAWFHWYQGLSGEFRFWFCIRFERKDEIEVLESILRITSDDFVYKEALGASEV